MNPQQGYLRDTFGMAQELPSGRVTFAFTDVVGSTRAITEQGEAYAIALPRLHQNVADVTVAHGGTVVKTEGDGAFLAFSDAGDAVRALREIQERLELPPVDGLHLRIRAGAHTGTAEPVDNDYLALAVHVAARVSSAAGAGQVLVSDSVLADLDAATVEDARPVDVGVFELKDIREPTQLWRIAGDEAPPRATPVRRTNVALAHSSFVGRDLELDELHRLLGSAGLVTVVGPGGVGKTRLVSEYAVRNAPTRADGIWMVELAHLTTPDQVPATVALALGLSGTPSPESLAAEVTRRGAPLLIIDNCEHLADAAADLIADLLRLVPGLSVVATSREPLDVDGELVQRVAPLTVSESAAAVTVAAMSPAEELFLSRAQAAGGAVRPEDLAVVSDICQLLDGLPLAVELAAARVAYQSPPDLLAELRHGDLHLRRRGGAQRQRSLEALVGWSLDLLDAPHRDALLVLSVFPGRFTRDMARHVLDAVPGLPLGVLSELSRRSLIDLDGTDYRMLVTIRDVMKAEVSSRPDLHTTALAGLFAWAVDMSRPGEQRREVRRWMTEPQARALEAALAWSVPARRAGSGHVMQTLTAWMLAHMPSQAAQSLARTVLLGPAPTSSDEVRLHAASMRLAGGLAFSSSVPVDEARELLTAARTYEAEEPDGFVYAVNVAASVLGRNGHLEEALALQRQLVDLATDELDRSVALTDTGVTYHLLGDLEHAEQYYRQAIEVTAEDNPNYLVLMGNLGEVLLDAGRFDEAAAQLRNTFRLTHGRVTLHAWALGMLVVAEAERGAVDVVRALAGDAETGLEDVVRSDASVSYVLHRLRETLARLPV